MRLLRIPEPFDHPDFVFEPKLDGFGALARIERHRSEVISRNGNLINLELSEVPRAAAMHIVGHETGIHLPSLRDR